MAASGKGMSEYILRLGTQIDNQGVQQILQYMDMNRLKALGLTAALTGITTAIYKIASATAQKEYELQKFAKLQHKTTAAVNAQNTALKSMGKTLAEVNRDKDLKAVYNDLKKFNEEMKLPNVDKAMENVTKLRNAFWKLKDAINYAVQGIGRQFLINMEAPIKRITGGLNNLSEWVKNNLNSIATKVSSYMTAFAKGVIAIGETVGKIFEWINQMPSAIKAIGLAFGAIAAALTMGPLGRIISAFMVVGDIVHDAENYQWNKNNAKTGEYIDPETGEPVKVKTALDPIWSILFDEENKEKTVREKASEITKTVIQGILDGITDAINLLNQPGSKGLSEWLGKVTGPLGDAIGGIVDWVRTDEGRAKVVELVRKIGTAIRSVITTAGEIGVDLTATAAEMLYRFFGGTDWKKAWDQSGVEGFLREDNSFAVGMATALETALAGGDFLTSLMGGLISGYQESRKYALQELYNSKDDAWKEAHKLTSADVDKEGNPLYTWLEAQLGMDPDLAKYIGEDLKTDFNDMMNMVLPMLFNGLTVADTVAGDILKFVIEGIANGLGTNEDQIGSTVKAALGEVGENNVLFNAIATGFGTWIATGNFFVGLITAVGDAFAQYTKDGGGGTQKLKEDAAKLKQAVLTLWFGAWDEEKGDYNGVGLKTFFDELFGDEGFIKPLLDDFASNITTWLEPVASAIKGFFEKLWYDIWSTIPPFFRQFIQDPSYASVKENSDGTWTVSSTNGNSKIVTAGEAAALLNQGIENYSVDKDGNIYWRGNGKTSMYNDYDSILKDAKEAYYHSKEDGRNETVYDSVLNMLSNDPEFSGLGGNERTNAINSALEARWKQHVGNRNESMVAYSEALGIPYGFLQLEVDANTDPAQQKITALNGQVVTVYGKLLLGDNQGYSQSGLGGEIGGDIKPENARTHVENQVEKAWGGRIGRRMDGVTVGEDGTEYIIPITKTGRAVSLIRQMLNEMGSSAMSEIVGGLGLGQSGTNGASLSSLETALTGMASGSSITVNAPININVNSTGADAKEIGSSVYDLAERHLIKNVMGVYS